MRENKFRAWDKEQKKMWIHEEDTGDNFDKMNGIGGFYYNYGVCDYYKEDFILMQYTGLKDCNNVEIYEGDILKGKDGKINVVVWSNKLSGYILGTWLKKGKQKDLDINTLEEKLVDCSYFIADKDEIIGNIYKNPELLGQK